VRILFLSQLLPLPLDAGPKIRAYYVLRHLAAAGHDVTLMCFVRSTDREADVREIARLCSSVETVRIERSRVKDLRYGVESLASRMPFLILRDRVAEMDARLSRTTRRRSFDAVHADQLWMAPYAARCTDIQLKVLDEHNAVFRVPQRLAANQRNPLVRTVLRREAQKLAAFERATLEEFDHVVWVSDDDRRACPGVADTENGRHQTIPIAADPTAQRPVERLRPFRVTFLGGIHWPPNAEGVKWFADRVWPRVAASAAGCVFTVIGKGSPRWLARADAEARIEVTGYVAALDRYLAETAAFVVPLHTGAGMRVKILDAWAWALPVVSTSIGAEGIRARHNENLLLADDEETFAHNLIQVLTNRGLADRLSANGRATVEARYDWRTVYRAWDQIYH